MEVLVDGTTVFVRAPGLGALVGATTPWVRVDPGRVDPSTAELVLGRWAAFQPAWMLASLGGLTGAVAEIGPQSVAGTATTHYRATLDTRSAERAAHPYDRVAVGAAMAAIRRSFGVVSFPVDLWVGADGLLRRARYQLGVAAPGAGGVGMTLTCVLEVSGFDAQASVSLPSPDRVTIVGRAPRSG
jgi:hypothetical protein